MRLDIPINADLGEGVGNDAQLMPFLSSCNIACGGHTGDVQSMEQTVLLAQKYSVKIGAHPSFADRANFGRKILKIPHSALSDSIFKQIISLVQLCDRLSLELNHIKPHGALYNLAAKDHDTAMAVLDAVDRLPKKLPIYTLPNSKISHLAGSDFEVLHEAFLDRKYLEDGSLMPRSKTGAVLTDKTAIWEQCKNLFFKHKVSVASGGFIPLKAQTFCIHGDTPTIYNALLFIRDQLNNANQ